MVVPKRVVVKRGDESAEIAVAEVATGDVIADASPAWTRTLREGIADAKTVLWNGPLGNYEAGFREGSVVLAELIADSTAYSIVGGGDTLAVINELGLSDQFSFVSTGGGAMLDFLASGTLPGIAALRSGE